MTEVYATSATGESGLFPAVSPVPRTTVERRTVRSNSGHLAEDRSVSCRVIGRTSKTLDFPHISGSPMHARLVSWCLLGALCGLCGCAGVPKPKFWTDPYTVESDGQRIRSQDWSSQWREQLPADGPTSSDRGGVL